MRTFCQKNRYPLLLLSLTILLAGSYLIWPTLAKFQEAHKLEDQARTAVFVGNSLATIELKANTFSPGETEELTFMLSNLKADRKTEVTTQYQIQLETFGTVPIDYQLLRVIGDTEKQVAFGESVEMAAATTQPEIHTYKIKVRWPEGKNQNYYQDDMQIQRLKIQTEQID